MANQTLAHELDEMTDVDLESKLREAKEWNRVGAIWIDNNECIRCGACFKVCPVKCISITRNEFVEVDQP